MKPKVPDKRALPSVGISSKKTKSHYSERGLAPFAPFAYNQVKTALLSAGILPKKTKSHRSERGLAPFAYNKCKAVTDGE